MSDTEWPEVTLGDHVDLLSGFAFKSKEFTDDPEAIPLVKGENVHQGFIDWKIAKRWPSTQLEGCEKYFLEPEDVVLAMDRPWIEAGLKWAWIRPEHPKALLVQRVSRMRGLGDLDTRFLRYIIGSHQFTDYIRPIVTGVNVPHISGGQIKGFKFRLPPLPTQRKIALILSAYDDLIENNTRRIAILEEMAQAIYREWFVNFRFPGHENVKLVDSPLGKIPEGWLKPLGDVVTLKRGYDLPQKDRRPGKVPIVSSSGVTDYHDSWMVEGPGVVTGRYGTLGKVFFVDGEFWPLNTSLYVQEFHGNEPLLVVHLLQSLDLANQNAAGAVPGLNRNALHMIDVVFPPNEFQREILPFIYSIENQSRNLRKKNDNLRTTRDLLLPKLISGQLDVEDLDIDVSMTAEELTEAAAG